MKRGDLARNLALSVASVLVVLVFVEGVARILANDRGGKEQREAHRYATYDPVLGWRKAPNREIQFSRRDFVTKVRINSQGLRDAERPVAKPAGEFRVVALGDSFIEAYMMGDAETPTARLAQELGRPGCPIDVVNGGTFGYSTDQEFLAYDRDLHRYEPDVVALFVYHNDIPPLLWGPDKPVLDFSTDPPSVSNEPVLSRFTEGAPLSAVVSPTPAQVGAPAPTPVPVSVFRSEALALLRARLDAAPPSLRDRLVSLDLVPPLPPFDLNDEIFLYARQPPEHLQRAMKVFQKTLAALKRRVEKDKARLLVVYIPARFEVNPQDWERTLARYRIGNRRFDPRSVVFRLMTAAAQEDVPFLDLTDELKAAGGLLAGPYFETDSHWNARGAAAGARAVARKLFHLGWAPSCAVP
jgi:lysophospholipase L1-like esterase